MEQETILSVKNLSISFPQNKKIEEIIHSISFELKKNEILAIVGESGSGKSITSLATLGLLDKKAILKGNILFKNEELLSFSETAYRNIRGRVISMIFQEPMSSLNPSLTCGYQVVEILKQHTELTKEEAKEKTLLLFEKVKLPGSEGLFNVYPHQISGGQKQRVMIAMAIACEPEILIADEPTTALDVTVQKEIIQLLRDIQKETGMSIIFISHDLSLVREIADRVLVMYKGDIVEDELATTLFQTPTHNYTKALLHARPSLENRLLQLPTISDYLTGTIDSEIEIPEQRTKRLQELYKSTPLLEVKNVEKTYISKTGMFGKTRIVRAVDDISFSLYEGETLGLVGESGCGKSTLGNAILQLDKASAGSIIYKGKNITTLKGKQLRALRKDIQIIFQDPYASLNPRLTVGEAITEPMEVHKLFSTREERREKAMEILGRVGLESSHYDRYPHEFSGGQRQRIGIARTIAVQPKLIICDESVSALDISVQAQVLNLLNELKKDFKFTYIFISHDLAVVKYMADQLVVMNKGKIEEIGEADSIYANPQKTYTKNLISAIPKGI